MKKKNIEKKITSIIKKVNVLNNYSFYIFKLLTADTNIKKNNYNFLWIKTTMDRTDFYLQLFEAYKKSIYPFLKTSEVQKKENEEWVA